MMAHTPLAYLNAQFGWRYALLIDGMVGVVLFIWIMLVVRNKPEEDSLTIKTSAPAAKHLRSVLLNPQNLLAGLYTACLNLPVMVICALWGASYLQVVHGLSQMAASNVVSLIYMGSIVGCPMVGWLSDALGRRKTLMIIGAIFCGLLTLPLLMTTMLPKSVLGLIFFALGFFSSTQVITYPLIAESNPEENTGIATGIASTIIMGGAGIGQVLFGWLMQQHAGLGTQQYALPDFQFAMAMFPIASIVALIAILFARETYCGRRN
jgi:sugar phosphate permease